MGCLLKKLLIILFFVGNVFSNEIKIGMSADFSSSISYLGTNMRIGVLSFLNTYNETSTIKYKLISYDDQYNPIKASANVRKLIDKDKVMALLANVGTPTTNVVIPILNEKKVVLFGTYSGGVDLRTNTLNEYVFNYRASYSQEAYLIAKKLLLQGVKPEEIALFSQNDTYGDSGYYGVIKAFQEFTDFDIRELVHGRYTRGTLNIENALSKMLDFDVNFKAIILISVDKPSIKFIKHAKEDFPNAKFFTLSPINIVELKKHLPKYSKDIYSTQVVPLLDLDLEIVKEYKRSLAKYFPNEKENLISLEGYISAKLFFETIKNLSFEELNKKSIHESLHTRKDIDIGLGYSSSFQNSSHQFSNKIWLTRIKNGNIVQTDLEGLFLNKE